MCQKSIESTVMLAAIDCGRTYSIFFLALRECLLDAFHGGDVIVQVISMPIESSYNLSYMQDKLQKRCK